MRYSCLLCHYKFADPLGEIGILNEWISASVPYLSVILLIALIQIRLPRKIYNSTTLS